MLKMRISYDKEADVVYFSFGEPVEVESEEIEEEVFARLDPKTKKLVEVTIISFSKKFGMKAPRNQNTRNHRLKSLLV